MYICKQTQTHTHEYIHITQRGINKHTFEHTQTDKYMNLHGDTQTNTHTHTHTHTNTYIHTHTHKIYAITPIHTYKTRINI